MHQSIVKCGLWIVVQKGRSPFQQDALASWDKEWGDAFKKIKEKRNTIWSDGWLRLSFPIP